MGDTTNRAHAPGVLLHGAGWYDFALWLITFGRERALRERMLDLAGIAEGDSVLDVGCGTGTLTILARQRAGVSGSACGIDASPEMIARAQRKARKSRLALTFQIAAAQSLPFPDERFDVVLATIMLHHLGRPARAQCVQEIRRVLKPNGRALIVDFESSAKRHGILSRLHRRHGHVAALDVDALLHDAGLTVMARGAVGFRDLHYATAVRATA
jgi:ubiquinone/menaquinone biosynthesis C-methylase UbiE